MLPRLLESRLMPLQVLQRFDWHGESRALGELFAMKKGSRSAVCSLVSHQLGWECRLYVGRQDEIVQTQVCRTEEEVFTTGEQWKAALRLKGWS